MNIKVGDRITFRAITRHNSAKATRMVNGFWLDTGNPTVRFEGCGNFVVRLHEISEINGEDVSSESDGCDAGMAQGGDAYVDFMYGDSPDW